jgi:hypothetical protein
MGQCKRVQPIQVVDHVVCSHPGDCILCLETSRLVGEAETDPRLVGKGGLTQVADHLVHGQQRLEPLLLELGPQRSPTPGDAFRVPLHGAPDRERALCAHRPAHVGELRGSGRSFNAGVVGERGW